MILTKGQRHQFQQFHRSKQLEEWLYHFKCLKSKFNLNIRAKDLLCLRVKLSLRYNQ